MGKGRKRKSPHIFKEAIDKFLFFQRVCPVAYSLLSSPLNTRETVFQVSKRNATTPPKTKKSLILSVSDYIAK
jgi:hypothetical protein